MLRMKLFTLKLLHSSMFSFFQLLCNLLEEFFFLHFLTIKKHEGECKFIHLLYTPGSFIHVKMMCCEHFHFNASMCVLVDFLKDNEVLTAGAI